MPDAWKDWIRFDYEPLSDLEIPVDVLGGRDTGNHYEREFVHGFFYALPFQGGTKAGFFKRKGKWYAVDKRPGEPMNLTHLKGIRVKIWMYADSHADSYIRFTRTPNAENIVILPSRQTL